jgi:tripartite-type tricarboxylate transporter receptor subunit TctC
MVRADLIKHFILCCLALFFSNIATAQWPNRPVTMVVPVSPGAILDLVGRELSFDLQRYHGQPFLIENRIGEGGITAMQFVARSAADGYTLLFRANYPLAAINGGQGFDLIGDLTAIGIVGEMPYFLVARKGTQLSSISAVQQASRTRELNIGIGGYRTSSHVGAAVAAKIAGIRGTLVPYKSMDDAISEVSNGHVDLAVVNANTLKVKAELAIVPLAVMSTKRLASYPNVPTFSELGFPEVVVSDFYALMAPRATSSSIVASLYKAMSGSQNLTANIQSLGMIRVSYSPQESTDLLRSDMELRRAVVKTGLIKLD